MLISLIRRNNFATIIFCFVILLLLWLPRLFLDFESGANLSYEPIAAQSLWLRCLFNETSLLFPAFFLTLLSAYFLLILSNRYLNYSLNGFLFPLFYVVIASAFPATQWLSGVQVVVPIIILGLHYLFRARQKLFGVAEFFLAVFCFSCAAMCFPPAVLMLLLPIILFVLITVNWRYWIAFIIAAALPFAYLLLYYWVFTKDITPATDALLLLLPTFPPELPVTTIPQIIFFVIVAWLLLLIFSSGFLQRTGTKAQNVFVHTVFTLMLLLFAAGFFFYPIYNYQLMPLLALPVAAILPDYFARRKNRKKKIIGSFILIAAVVYLQVVEFL